jgi:quercetin dioxygenase-like cupin family protein
MAVFIPPNEEHQFKALDNRPLEFHCIIPRK